MTKFEKDMKFAVAGDWLPVLRERRAELDRLVREGRQCKNAFRCHCIAQEVARLEKEFEEISSAAC